MKHKKEHSNVKSVNKPARSPAANENATIKETKNSGIDDHQEIVKRLMTHSQLASSPTFPVVPMTHTHPTPITTITTTSDTYNYPYYHSQYPSMQQYHSFQNAYVTPPLSSPSSDYVFNGDFLDDVKLWPIEACL